MASPHASTLPWIEKYRPSAFCDISDQNHVIKTVLKLVAEKQMPHLLFYGPPGTGKTSTILTIARAYFGDQAGQMTLELNASDDRGIEVVRNEIQSFASSQRIFSSGYKLVILDECDSMTKDAQFALRRVIEKYTKHTRFCLIGNYASKIIPALQSRCMKFRFAPFQSDIAQNRIRHISTLEGIGLSEEALLAIVTISGGDLRRACNLLQGCALTTSNIIDERTVYSVAGVPLPSDLETAMITLLNDDLLVGVNTLQSLTKIMGVAVTDIVSLLSKRIFELHLSSTVRADIISALADMEVALSHVSCEKFQLRALASVFTPLKADTGNETKR
jgi:replication factor C subunit 3/5